MESEERYVAIENLLKILDKKYSEDGFDVTPFEVPGVPLSKICNEYVGQWDIHFLKNGRCRHEKNERAD